MNDGNNPFTGIGQHNPAVKAIIGSGDLDLAQKLNAIAKLIGETGMNRIAAELHGQEHVDEVLGTSELNDSGSPADTIPWAEQRKALGIDKLGNGTGRRIGSQTSSAGLFD